MFCCAWSNREIPCPLDRPLRRDVLLLPRPLLRWLFGRVCRNTSSRLRRPPDLGIWLGVTGAVSGGSVNLPDTGTGCVSPAFVKSTRKLVIILIMEVTCFVKNDVILHTRTFYIHICYIYKKNWLLF